MSLSLIGAICIGLFGNLLAPNNHSINPEMIFLIISDKLLPQFFSSIILAAVLSAIMSTISSQLHTTSTSLTEMISSMKILQGFHQIWITRTLMIIIIIIASACIYSSKSTIINLTSFAWAGLGSSFGTVMLFILYSKKMTKQGALSGMIVGCTVVLIWHLCKKYEGIFRLYEIIPGFILGSIAIIVANNIVNSNAKY
jgi:sodium/proline symporter